MKFLVSKDLEPTNLLKNLLVALSIALLFYFIFDLLVHAYLLGFSFQDISSTLYGNHEEFIEPILIDSLLLQVHIDLFFSLLSTMIIASIYIRLFNREKRTKRLIHLLFFLNFFSPIILIIAYLSFEVFVSVWILFFLASHSLNIIISILIIKKLLLK